MQGDPKHPDGQMQIAPVCRRHAEPLGARHGMILACLEQLLWEGCGATRTFDERLAQGLELSPNPTRLLPGAIRLVLPNPVRGVKRPPSMNRDGVTPALGDDQELRRLEAPLAKTLQGKRDRTMLAVLLYLGIRRDELCTLKVGDIQSRQGVWHVRIEGKREKSRSMPLAIAAPHHRLPGRGEARGRDRRAAVPAGEKQHAPNPGQAPPQSVRLGYGPAVYHAGRHHRDRAASWRACEAGDGRHQRSGVWCRHRHGAGVAEACWSLHHATLR